MTASADERAALDPPADAAGGKRQACFYDMLEGH
jgi:hypothetical protein